MTDALDALTDKEKETLRLIVRGHDAKSMARELGLSVHTINERLRAARRKLSVTSSKEAARLLLKEEQNSSEKLGAKEFGEARGSNAGDGASVPETRQSGGWGKGLSTALLLGGLVVFVLAAALLLSTPLASGGAGSTDTDIAARDAAVEAAARSWLALVDAGDWHGSYAATAKAFRQANTPKLWSDTSRKVVGELGAVESRQFLGADDVPSPQGFTMVKFRTDFAHRKGTVETLSLVHEEGTWKVAGIYVS